jgi:cytochrome b561
MKLTNSFSGYGWISIALHWVIAVCIIGLFALGLWMVDLSFYSPWYHDAPAIHKSLGVLLIGLMALRLVWRWGNPTPKPPANHSRFVTFAAHSAHALLYLLVFALGVSGYFISTAEGHGIDVFNWFTVPAYPLGIENQADIAGEFHYWIAVTLIVLAGVHMLAALKHHFIDKDVTLKRMLKATNE